MYSWVALDGCVSIGHGFFISVVSMASDAPIAP